MIVNDMIKAIDGCKPGPAYFEINPRDMPEIFKSINFHDSYLFDFTSQPMKFQRLPIIERIGLVGWRCVARRYSWELDGFNNMSSVPVAPGVSPYPDPINWQSDDFDETEALKYEKAREEYERKRCAAIDRHRRGYP